MIEDLARSAAEALAAVRERKPLVHNITNYVVMDFSANALLALGASPVMAHAIEEVEEMASLAGALVLNIGTLSGPWIESMFAAGRAASRLGTPIILDPVGAGATRLRTDTATRLLSDAKPTVVRGNASEILALARQTGATKGVDSTRGVDEARDAARGLAAEHRAIIAVTGPVDFVTDGARALRVEGGHALMGRVTGTGCVASAIVGAFCAVESDALRATAGALAAYKLAGEIAAAGEPRPGTFRTRLIDALDEVGPALVAARAKILEI
jgi:hydroxyethylthiazole kinase